MPGAETEKGDGKSPGRGGFRSSGIPQLVGENQDDYKTELCPRVWYTSHRPESRKRSASPDEFSPDVIHDVHLTPRDFEFQSDGTLQRRADGNDGFVYNEDCELEVEPDGPGSALHAGILVHYGGDDTTLSVFGTWGEETFMNKWMEDVKKLPTFKIDTKGNKVKRDEEISRSVSPGINCWKFDLDGGAPAAYLAYAISDTTEYKHKNPNGSLASARRITDDFMWNPYDTFLE